MGTTKVARISSDLGLSDRLGWWKARWGIGRMNYLVPPGLYAIGTPTPGDPVVVTANYKMSYDLVRRCLSGRNIWLLILETFGINVWCAAGKGTFGTEELINRVRATGLEHVVTHRRLLLPILGAPGVAAHQVTRQTGFTVRFATIRAADLTTYLDNGMVTTPEMRELTFTFRERLVLIPVELVLACKTIVFVGGGLFLVAAALNGVTAGLRVLTAYLGAVVTGIVVAPLLLPWLPGRSFSIKGVLPGLAWCGIWYAVAGGVTWNWPVTAATFLSLPTVTAWYSLNFTGCTTYTSRSGVLKEMRSALPVMGCALVISALLVLMDIVL